MTLPRKDRLLPLWPLFAILAVGCTLRAILLAQFSRLPLFRHPLLDSLVYHQQALEIAGGKLVGDQAFFFGPLYPYLLGLFYTVFGNGALVPRMLNIVLELATITLVFFLARCWCGGRTRPVCWPRCWAAVPATGLRRRRSRKRRKRPAGPTSSSSRWTPCGRTAWPAKATTGPPAR